MLEVIYTFFRFKFDNTSNDKQHLIEKEHGLGNISYTLDFTYIILLKP
jgi:hypothetical protein